MTPSMLPIARGTLLSKLLGDDMPRKYQNPKLQHRADLKRPYWFIRVSIPGPDGRRRRVARNLGFCDEVTKKEAMQRRAATLELVNAGRIMAETQIRFRDLVGHFKTARLPQFGVGTQARYLSQIENHLLPAFGERRLSEIDKPSVEAWLTGKETTLSWWTREGLRSVLAALFSAAREWKLWSGDLPTIGVRLGRRIVKREVRILTAEQLQAILAAVSDRTRFMILIALLLGLRISEVCGLQWQDIDLERCTLSVRRRWYRGDVDEPKSQRSRRTLELGPLAAEFRARYPGPQARNEWVFRDGSNPPDERDILRFELRPKLKDLGLYYEGFGWHAFRRQNISWRQSVGGATPLEAQKSAGHARVDLTLLYTQTEAERERDQVGKMFDKLMAGPDGLKQ